MSNQSSHSLNQPINISLSVKSGARKQLRSSDSKKIRRRFLETYPSFEASADLWLPTTSHLHELELKKPQADPDKHPFVFKLYYVQLKGSKEWDPLFYSDENGKEKRLVPHLKLIHRYPDALPRIRIDRGAIRFVLSGANLMVPGLTSPGGRLPSEEAEGEDERYGKEDLEAGTVVVIEAEGKEHACMVGPLEVGTKVMKDKKKGLAMSQGHYLGDAMWTAPLE